MLRRRVVFALMRIAATVALLLATVAGLIRQPTFVDRPPLIVVRPTCHSTCHSDRREESPTRLAHRTRSRWTSREGGLALQLRSTAHPSRSASTSDLREP